MGSLAAHMGLVRLSAFIMQSLTAEKGLSSKLDLPLDLKLSLRSKYNVPGGSVADFLIVSRRPSFRCVTLILIDLTPCKTGINLYPHFQHKSKIVFTLSCLRLVDCELLGVLQKSISRELDEVTAVIFGVLQSNLLVDGGGESSFSLL